MRHFVFHFVILRRLVIFVIMELRHFVILGILFILFFKDHDFWWIIHNDAIVVI